MVNLLTDMFKRFYSREWHFGAIISNDFIGILVRFTFHKATDLTIVLCESFIIELKKSIKS
jgi:hypothetical protein